MQNISEITQSWANTLDPLCQGPEQKKALLAFSNLGLPDQHLESWAYTKTLSALSDLVPSFAQKRPMDRISILQGRPGLTLQDGRIIEYVLPKDFSYQKLPREQSLHFLDGFDTLHGIHPEAHTNLISTSKTASDEEETLLVHVRESESAVGTITPTRLKFAILPNRKVNLIFVLNNVSNPGLSLSHIELGLEENAQVRVAIITSANSGRLTFHRWRAFLKRDARLDSVILTMGGQPTRHEFEAQLLETGATVSVQGLYLLKQKHHADIHTIIHHMAPHTTSSQLLKAVVQDEAHGVYTGKVVIHPGATGSNAGQKALGLLLSKQAHFSTRPQLEVCNDDVKCGHGAAVGQLNEDESFYLASRGIPPERTRQILLAAFVGEILQNVSLPMAKFELESAVSDYFQTSPGHLS
ncbi:MAG: SufD family Fe-S cluster assembly protein [Bdellovibrio sp.]|nr:SufD family Fe-S cluster assembly protein [Bdellovibrio sp.]